jgi:hypothetical protein
MKYLIILLIFFSCSIPKGFRKVSYKISDIKMKYSLFIPKEYKRSFIEAGEWQQENVYLYKDSSLIYISNWDAPQSNYKNILTLGDSITNFRFKDIDLARSVEKVTGVKQKILPDTFKLEGMDAKQRYWKDIHFNGNSRSQHISIGYMNVPLEKKLLFDKALHTLVIKK